MLLTSQEYADSPNYLSLNKYADGSSLNVFIWSHALLLLYNKMNNCIYSINLLLFSIVLSVKLIVTGLTGTKQEKVEIVAWSLDQIFIFITLNWRLSFKKKVKNFCED